MTEINILLAKTGIAFGILKTDKAWSHKTEH